MVCRRGLLLREKCNLKEGREMCLLFDCSHQTGVTKRNVKAWVAPVVKWVVTNSHNNKGNQVLAFVADFLFLLYFQLLSFSFLFLRLTKFMYETYLQLNWEWIRSMGFILGFFANTKKCIFLKIILRICGIPVSWFLCVAAETSNVTLYYLID